MTGWSIAAFGATRRRWWTRSRQGKIDATCVARAICSGRGEPSHWRGGVGLRWPPYEPRVSGNALRHDRADGPARPRGRVGATVAELAHPVRRRLRLGADRRRARRTAAGAPPGAAPRARPLHHDHLRDALG